MFAFVTLISELKSNDNGLLPKLTVSEQPTPFIPTVAYSSSSAELGKQYAESISRPTKHFSIQSKENFIGVRVKSATNNVSFFVLLKLLSWLYHSFEYMIARHEIPCRQKAHAKPSSVSDPRNFV
jgi:hypothetical protein